MLTADAHLPLLVPVEICECCRRPRSDLAFDAPCPDCGIQPSANRRFEGGFSPPPAFPRPPAPVACSACGYSIENLSPDGRCPECGLEIRRTLQGDGLHLADPKYLEHVERGAAWITLAAALPVVLGLVALNFTPLFLLILFALPLLLLAALCGVGLVTAPDTRFPEDTAPHSIRQLARTSAISAGVLECATLSSLAFADDDLYIIAVSATVLFFLLTFLMTSRHIQRVASRMQRKPLERLAAISTAGWSICLVLLISTIVLFALGIDLASVLTILIFLVGIIAAPTFLIAVFGLGKAARAATLRQPALAKSDGVNSEAHT